MPTTNTAHLDLDRIDLRILRLVLILSNTQSLTKTAAAMKLSVSQASRLLADARAIFGTEIFSRHGPQMVPSPQLLELLPRLHNVFKALDALLGGASTLNILESSEVIRIAAVDNTAMVFIMPFHEISSQRFLQSPFFLANAWSLLDSDGYTIHPIPLAEILTEHLPLAALKPKDIVIPPWVPHLYWSVRTDADPLRQWVRSFLISCARRRWSRYCSDDEAGWREAMASLEAASICSVCSE